MSTRAHKERLEEMILETSNKRPRGLAAMSPERRREIASKGGRTSQARGTAHQWTAEEASAAGKKGSARYALRKAGVVHSLASQ
jgi:general stress protein YciG